MFVPPKTLKLEGQEFIYNEESKTVVVEITQPFLKAGHILAWEPQFGIPGLGINRSIIKFTEQSRSKLLVKVLSNPGNKDYWINHDKLKNFIKNHSSEYSVSGKIIHVIPWMLFSAKPNFTGDKQQ